MTILLFFAAISIGHILYLVSTYLASRIYCVSVEEVVLFYGARILNIKHGEMYLRMGILPFGGYVKFSESDFTIRPFHQKIILLLSGIVGPLLIGLMMTSVDFNSMLLCFIRGTIHPEAYGVGYVQKLTNLTMDDPLNGFGIIFVAMAFFNMLPVPVTNGGQILLLAILRNRPTRDGIIHNILMWLGVIVVVGLLLSYGYVLYRAVMV
jgi:hypothetical protein